MQGEFFDVLIVGAGHAGAQAAIALRRGEFAGSIAVIGEEPELPYERPPLSKDYLSGEKAFERIMIRSPGFWDEREVRFLLNARVVKVDAARHCVVTDAGRRIGYGKLIWAAGGHPRRLSCVGHDLVGVHAVRTRADVDRLLTEIGRTQQVVVIGGGYIGLEAAAALAKFGKSVTVVEAQNRVLARVAGEALSRFFEGEHRAHGVTVMLDQAVECIEGQGAVSGVRLADGTVLPAQMVIIGIGIVPAVEPLLGADAEGGNGVRVDAQCRTTLADIFAVGDCAAHPNRFADGAIIRLESVQNANDQAMIAAKTILGEAAEYDAVPWFWSNQYDLKLQTVGLSTGHDEWVVRGTIADRSFSIIYLRGGRVVALDCVNAARDYVQGRALVNAGTRLPIAALRDASVSLKDLAAASGETPS